MNELIAIIILAWTVEGVITYLKELSKEWHWSFAAAIGLGLLIAFGYDVDLPKILGKLLDVEITSTIPYVGNVLGGIAIARGSNYIFDAIGWISTIKDKIQTELPTVNLIDE